MEQEREEQEQTMGHPRTWEQQGPWEWAKMGSSRAQEHHRQAAAAPPGTLGWTLTAGPEYLRGEPRKDP